MAVQGLQGAQRDAFTALTSYLRQFGLQSLAGRVLEFVQNGYSQDTIAVMVQDTPEWKQRFAGNERRRAKGLPVLAPAEYLDLEGRYRQVMRAYGLPTGMFDRPDDFVKFMESDVAPTELQSRLELRRQVITSGAMTGVREYWRSNFGLGEGDMLALWIDPQRALPELERQVQAAQIGAAAQRTGFGGIHAQTAMRLGDLGVTREQAEQGFGQAAQLSELLRTLPGQAAGNETTRPELVGALLENDADDVAKVRRASQSRTAAFQGQGSYATSDQGVVGLRRADR